MKNTYTIDLTSVGNQSEETKTFLENATNEETTKWLVDQVMQGNIYIDSMIEDEVDFDEDQWEIDVENKS